VEVDVEKTAKLEKFRRTIKEVRLEELK